jgi:hypothetical protein
MTNENRYLGKQVVIGNGTLTAQQNPTNNFSKRLVQMP